MRSRSSSRLNMRRSVVVLAGLLLGCYPCERRTNSYVIAEENRYLDAPLELGTNAIRMRCQFDVHAPSHDRLNFFVNWFTDPLQQGTVSADIHLSSSFAPEYAQSTTWMPSSNSTADGFGIGYAPDLSPCDEQCSFAFEVTVRVSEFPGLGTETIPAKFRVGVAAFKTTDSDVPEGTITLDCDPVEHLTLP